MSCLPALALMAICSAGDAAAPINPFPRARLPEQSIVRWEFDRDTEGWAAQNQCTLAAGGGLLKVHCTGNDPFMHRPAQLPGGDVVLKLKVRSRTGGNGQLFWTTDQSPGRGEDKTRHFGLRHDGRWHEYAVPFAALGTITDLRLDPGSAPGEFEIDWIELRRVAWHPLSIERAETEGGRVRFVVENHEAEPLEITALGKTYSIAGKSTLPVECPASTGKPLEAVTLEVQVKGRSLPAVRRTAFVFRPEAAADWIVRPLGDCSLEVARDGTVARVQRDGRTVAALAPLVHCDGHIPALRLVQEESTIRFEGEGVTLSVAAAGKEISVSIAGQRPCEGPVVRAFGELQGGLLAGLEYLGKGERSSTTLDIETEEHLRFAPDPLKVTMPLALFATDRATVALHWSDMQLQPTYATPDFFDGTSGHRMSLVGTKIDATVLVDRLSVEETIFWAVKKQGLPPLPPAPRSQKEQWDVCIKALNGPLKTEAGWGHCAEPNWGRAPHADMASTIWRLTGQIVPLDRVVPGGAHVANDSYYFITGRAAQWKEHHARQAEGTLRQQQPDGSYRYDGPFRRGHFENTANGVCARPAMVLLEYARTTGDKAALAAAVRTLDFMKRFDVPRGAQCWEIPLHTPDQLASAYAVWAYVRGYELTGNKEYLAEARRWALSGIPFVYLWTRYPVMLYAAPPVFGATHWKAPNWMGLPVQWVGGVYAYALTLLAPHDKSLDWNHLARGILISAEQQQYPDGEWIGLLPDSFVLATQQRNPARINPCALVSLRLVLDGQLDSLSVATDGKHRVIAPLPVTLRDGKALIQGRKGLRYQVLVDGEIVDVQSQGDDAVPLK